MPYNQSGEYATANTSTYNDIGGTQFNVHFNFGAAPGGYGGVPVTSGLEGDTGKNLIFIIR